MPHIFESPGNAVSVGSPFLVAAMDRSPNDSRILAMHDAMMSISHQPVWVVAEAAIEQGRSDPTLLAAYAP